MSRLGKAAWEKRWSRATRDDVSGREDLLEFLCLK
jgi:hypothetical protein